MISVRRLRKGESELFKHIRLTSLRESPSAFLSTYESALKRSSESWSVQADSTAEGSDRATFIAFSGDSPGDTPVGITAIYRDPQKPDTGEVLQVWVFPEYRGEGVAATLMDAVFDWAKENSFRRVIIGIMPGNTRALRFYQKYGFLPLLETSHDISENYLVKEIGDEPTSSQKETPMEPRIVEKPELLLIGTPFFGSPEGGEFAQTWERFVEHEKAIPNRVHPKEFYGLEFYTADFDKNRKWYYLACVEVTSLDDIPLPLVAKRLPACRYAVFTVRGGLANIGETFSYAHQTWFPCSEYEMAYPFDFEFYEEDRFKGGLVEDSELELYIPIRPKS